MSTILVRRESFLQADQVGPFDEQIPASFGEDYDWLLRATRQGSVRTIRQALVDVHWDGDSTFQRNWGAMCDGLRYLFDKHAFADRAPAAGRARILGQIAFAAAAIEDSSTFRTARKLALQANRREARVYLAQAVAWGVKPERVLAALHRFGRGI